MYVFLCSRITGFVDLDDNADRIADYNLWHLPLGADQYEEYVYIKMVKGNATQDVSL